MMSSLYDDLMEALTEMKKPLEGKITLRTETLPRPQLDEVEMKSEQDKS